MADKKNTYAGKISNSGAQKVESIFKGNTKKGKGTVHKGEDLRNGKK